MLGFTNMNQHVFLLRSSIVITWSRAKTTTTKKYNTVLLLVFLFAFVCFFFFRKLKIIQFASATIGCCGRQRPCMPCAGEHSSVCLRSALARCDLQSALQTQGWGVKPNPNFPAEKLLTEQPDRAQAQLCLHTPHSVLKTPYSKAKYKGASSIRNLR